MSHAETCPVCGGSGKLLRGSTSPNTGSMNEVKCYGWAGKGWVSVQGF